MRDEYAAARVTTLRLPAPYRLTHGERNPIAAWLDEDGLFGLRSHEKFVPDWVFGLPKEQVGLFLRHIWATDGSVGYDEKDRLGRVYYASTSRRLVDDLARLLLRFNVFTRIKRVRKAGYRDGWHLYIYGAENQLRFLRRDRRPRRARREGRGALAEQLRDVVPNTNLDTVPREVWGRVREVLAEQGMTHREFAAAMGTQFCGSTMWKHSPSRQRLAKVAERPRRRGPRGAGHQRRLLGRRRLDRAGRRAGGLRRDRDGHPQLRRRTASPPTTASSRTPTW